ncbi:MAG: transposase, partial [Gammaproteobacteria bacterium]|nr:transposase [Gammaproteobacteria bacterium]MYG68305.1 transposase [Gammaproteobacteria bacterium]
MANKAPGKHFRKGLTLLEVAEKFGDEAKARQWIEEVRWPEGPFCPHCGSFNVQSNIKHKTMTHRCRDCPEKPMFTVRHGTIMAETRLKYRVWAIGIYLYTTNIKGISSMKLHRELGITQKSAWFVLHRLRMAAEANEDLFSGPVEACQHRLTLSPFHRNKMSPE